MTNSYVWAPLFLGARSNSTRLRADVDNLQTQCANDMWSAWNNTNTSLQQRVTESTEAHNKLQSHLSKTMQEIYDQVHDYTLLGFFRRGVMCRSKGSGVRYTDPRPLRSTIHIGYGNMGWRVFKWRVQNWNRFLPENQHTQGNYWILRIDVMERSQKLGIISENKVI